jgi:hypothetical protein
VSGARADDAALAVIDKLNAEGDKKWSFEVVNHLVLENEVVVLGRLAVDGVPKMAFGTAAISRDGAGKAASVGSDLKVATNDALARAARLFGVGLVFEQPERATAPEEPARDTLSPENRVTQKQLGAINGLARRRNIGRSELGGMLHQRFAKGELVSLSKREASEFISELSGTNGHTSP